uniref:Uncharacterized protein n=1 Tax=Cacopsylla melanoneura TaxID=428564 RepID=A0A8D8WWD6_9HEMI
MSRQINLQFLAPQVFCKNSSFSKRVCLSFVDSVLAPWKIFPKDSSKLDLLKLSRLLGNYFPRTPPMYLNSKSTKNVSHHRLLDFSRGKFVNQLKTETLTFMLQKYNFFQ